MISNKASLVTRLGWVIKEVEQVIEQAKLAFNNYIQDESKTALVECSEQVESVHGSLDLVGADGAAMLAREIALLVNALGDGNVANIEEAKQALIDAFIRLPEYLTHLEEGYADLPVIILPLLNDLRSAREAELLSEHLVFLPESGAINNDDIGTNEYIPLSSENLQKACVRLRYHFQKSLLGWYNKDDREKSLQTLQRVGSNLIRLNESIRLRTLWWIVIALAEALEKNRLDGSITIKLLMGRMEREIRLLGELQEDGHNQAIPDELIKNLLYYVGLAESGGQTLDAVKSAYRLDLHLPQGETLEELRNFYSAPGRELWKSVASSLNKNIAHIIKSFSAIDENETAKVQLAPIIDQLAKVTGTLSVIGLNQARNIITTSTEKVSARVDENQHLNESETEKIAEELINLQQVLQEYANTGNDITNEVFSDSAMQSAETIRETQAAIIEELQASQECLVGFVESEAAFFQLDNALKHISNVKGAFILLSHADFIPLVDALITYLHDDLSVNNRQPSEQEESCLADVMAILEASVKTNQQDEDYTQVLMGGYDAIRLLDKLSSKELISEEQLEVIGHQLEQKKKKFQKIPPMIMKKITSL